MAPSRTALYICRPKGQLAPQCLCSSPSAATQSSGTRSLFSRLTHAPDDPHCCGRHSTAPHIWAGDFLAISCEAQPLLRSHHLVGPSSGPSLAIFSSTDGPASAATSNTIMALASCPGEVLLSKFPVPSPSLNCFTVFLLASRMACKLPLAWPAMMVTEGGPECGKWGPPGARRRLLY